MKPENSGLLLLLFLLFGGAIYTQVGGGPAAKGADAPSKTQLIAPGEAKNSELPPPCSPEVHRLIAEFFGLDPQASLSSDFFIAGKGKGYKLNFLIAAVPDPVDSHVGWRFDLFVDAIQRAVEVSGYVMDRFYLPWERARKAENKNAREPSEQLYETNPGVILFRHVEKSDPALLVLFLIGETPTSGLHKAAFECALDSIATFTMENQTGDQPVRVMGPNYSGSVTSLKIAIKNWYDNHRDLDHLRFTIISGSATNSDNKKILNSSTGEKPDVSFQATVISDDIILGAFKKYLNEELGDDSPVAVLTESNTSYGRGLVEAQKGQNWVSLPFPMNISRVWMPR
jgi:hypothetical protein